MVSSSKIKRVKQAVEEEEYLLTAIKEDGFTSRNINRWVEDKYLLKPPRANTWAKFNFVDYVWVKVLLCMSDLGVSKKSNSKGASQEEGNVNKIINCLAAASSLSSPSPLENQGAWGDISDEMTKRAAYQSLKEIIVDSLLHKASFRIHIYKEGICQLLRDGVIVAFSAATRIVDSDSFVQIALTDIFVDFVSKQILAGNGKDLIWKGLLTNPEGTLIEHIKYRIVQKLMVECDEQKSESLPVDEEMTEAVTRYLAKCMVKGNYQKITYVIAGTTSTFSSSDDDLD